MPPLDERLIDPPPEKLAELLRKAMRNANARLSDRRLDKDLFFFHQFVRRAARKAEGLQQWTGGRGGVPAAHLAAAWWTDRIGRRHWRVTGKRIDSGNRRAPQTMFHSHALWHLYPDRLAIRRVRGKDELVALCRCGVCGTLESVGWVGDRCGPCHDRAQEGVEVESGFATRLCGHSGYVSGLAFTADGRLVSGGHDGRILLWDLESGQGKELLPRSRAGVGTLTVSSSGVAATLFSQRVLLGQVDGGNWRDVTEAGEYPMGVCFSPDGRWLAVAGPTSVRLLNLEGGGWTPPPLPGHRPFAAPLFSADGKLLFVCDSRGGIQQIDPDTREARRLPRPEQLGLAEDDPVQDAWEYEFWDYSAPPLRLLAASPDGQFLVASGQPWDGDVGTLVLHRSTERWSSLGLPDEMPMPFHLTFLPDGRIAFSALDKGLRLWGPDQQHLLGPLFVDSPFDSAVSAFSADGELFAVGERDGSIGVWPWKRLLEGR